MYKKIYEDINILENTDYWNYEICYSEIYANYSLSKMGLIYYMALYEWNCMCVCARVYCRINIIIII